jgi:hypothetical protein
MTVSGPRSRSAAGTERQHPVWYRRSPRLAPALHWRPPIRPGVPALANVGLSTLSVDRSGPCASHPALISSGRGGQPFQALSVGPLPLCRGAPLRRCNALANSVPRMRGVAALNALAEVRPRRHRQPVDLARVAHAGADAASPKNSPVLQALAAASMGNPYPRGNGFSVRPRRSAAQSPTPRSPHVQPPRRLKRLARGSQAPGAFSRKASTDWAGHHERAGHRTCHLRAATSSACQPTRGRWRSALR